MRIRGTAYPVLLPTWRDPRLHLAGVIVTLQVLGQTAFDFRLSIAQILVSLVTCAVLEVSIAFRRQHVLMWPASALLTGNGVAFVLRVPGTEHGDWWSMNGWWIFAGTAAVGLLSKYVITFRGRHIFNPSNFGLVLCFVLLGPERADPLAFWWGPMSVWLALALVLIVGGGLAILSRLHLVGIAVGFWLTFAAGVAVLAATGHEMTAAWHLGPIAGLDLWWLLVTSPEVLVFLFFMITDPRTIPESPRGAPGVRSVGRPPRDTADRAVDERVLGEACRARRADDRLRRTAAAAGRRRPDAPGPRDRLVARPRGRGGRGGDHPGRRGGPRVVACVHGAHGTRDRAHPGGEHDEDAGARSDRPYDRAADRRRPRRRSRARRLGAPGA